MPGRRDVSEWKGRGEAEATHRAGPWEAEAEIEDLHGDDAFAGAAVDVGRGEEERLGTFSLGVAMAGVRVESTVSQDV